MKYGEVTLGQVEAAINKLGALEVWEAWLRGEKTVRVEDAVRSLFDKHGRRILDGIRAEVVDADRRCRLDQPKIVDLCHFADRLRRLHQHLGVDTGVTDQRFKTETECLLSVIKGDHRFANIAQGVHLPVVLPQFAGDDLGTELGRYTVGVGASYVETFGGRRFDNGCEHTLDGKVSFIDGSRHSRLVELMKEGPVIGIHFPNPLQGFSVEADREQLSTLPGGFVLSGLDTVVAMVMYPDVLARHDFVPKLDLAALRWQTHSTLFFSTDGSRLYFNDVGALAKAHIHCTSGMLFIG